MDDVPIRYIHIREYDPEAFIMVYTNPQPKPKGGATIAYQIVNGDAFCAAAYCSYKDSFNRKRGRVIAAGRLAADSHMFVVLGPFSSGEERNERIRSAFYAQAKPRS